MSPRTLGPPTPIWRIERFELIYYNARHRSWQYFAEGPIGGTATTSGSASAGVHRQHIPRFLSTFRDVVAAASSLGPKTPFELTPPPKADPHDEIVLEVPSFEGWAEHGPAYLDYLLASAEDEHLSPEVIDGLRRCAQAMKSGTRRRCRVPRHIALALLSLLPIREEWDTWGCFLQARQLQGRAGKLPPSRAGTDWFQPFYLAEFGYDGTRKTAPSMKVLKKEVTLEAACCDLSRRTSAMAFVAKNDFFYYCRRPTRRNNEVYLYRCYGHFVDDLIAKLSEAPTSQKPRARRPKSRFFVIAYPIQVAGRLHFAQIALTTTDSGVDVGSLWDDWAGIHEVLWVPECISAFESALERVSVSAFQLAVDERLRHHVDQSHDDAPTATLLAELAAEVFHVLPVRSVEAGGIQWAYGTYPPRRGGSTSSPAAKVGALLGKEWRQKEKTPRPYPTDVEVTAFDGIRLRVSAFGNLGLQKALIRNHAVNVIEQQLTYFEKRFAHLLAEERENRRRAEACVQQHIESLDADGLHRVSGGCDESAAAITLNAPIKRTPQTVEPFRCPRIFNASPESRQSLRRYIAQAKPHATSDRDLFAEYQQMAAPRPPELATRLLDSSLVKIATHQVQDISDYFIGTTPEEAQQEVAPTGYLGRTCAALHSALIAHGLTTDAKALDLAWNDFVCDLDGLKTLAELNGRLRSSRIATLRNQTWNGSLTIAGHRLEQRISRMPWGWLDSWLTTYAESAEGKHKRLTSSVEICNSHADVDGRLPSPHAGTMVVTLANKGLWLPYRIENKAKFEQSSSVLDAWFGNNCHLWAHLCLVYPATLSRSLSVRLARRVGNTNVWERLSPGSPLWAVFQNPVKAIADEDDALNNRETSCPHTTESLVVVVRTWVAS